MQVLIKRDGEIIHRCDDREVLVWFMQNTNQSMHYSLTYGGYTVEHADDQGGDNDRDV